MNQHTTLLNILDDEKFHCSNELRSAFVPEYRSRINELRKRGYTISKARCTLHTHKGMSQMWRLEGTPNYIITESIRVKGGIKNVCCPSFYYFQTHNKDCKSLIQVPTGQLF